MQSLLGYWLTQFLCLVLLRLALYELEGGAGGWGGGGGGGGRGCGGGAAADRGEEEGRRRGGGLSVCPSGTQAASEWELGTGGGRSGTGK
jgi:hypothetical protein